MPYLKREFRVPAVRIFYTVHGPKDGTPLLLTHGYSSTSGMWENQIPAFTNAGYKLILWDMRGHGRSAYPDSVEFYSEVLTVGDMEALLDEVCGKGEKAVVGGLSLGGYMSMAFYRMHPERVERLLIIDTGPGFKSDKAREGWNAYANKTAEQFDREGLAPLQKMSPERSQVRHRNANGLALAARGMLAQRNSAVIESLPQIRVPSLIVVGADDKEFLVAADYMTKKIPGAKKVLVPDAGHAVNIDQPEKFNEAVLAFLKETQGWKWKL